MFCTACGTELFADAAFCSNCGRAVRTLPAPSAALSGDPGPGPSWAGQRSPAPGAIPAGLAAPAIVPAQPWSVGRMITIADTRYQLAGFWVRLGALLVDWIVQFIVAFIIFFVIGLAFTDWAQVEANASSGDTPSAGVAVGYLLLTLFSVGYYWWGYARGATPGKKALGLRIVRGDGSNPGMGAGFARLIGTWVSWMFCGLGYLWVAWDAKKQAWHGKIADTYVVRGG